MKKIIQVLTMALALVFSLSTFAGDVSDPKSTTPDHISFTIDVLSTDTTTVGGSCVDLTCTIQYSSYAVSVSLGGVEDTTKLIDEAARVVTKTVESLPGLSFTARSEFTQLDSLEELADRPFTIVGVIDANGDTIVAIVESGDEMYLAASNSDDVLSMADAQGKLNSNGFTEFLESIGKLPVTILFGTLNGLGLLFKDLNDFFKDLMDGKYGTYTPPDIDDRR